MVKMNQIFFFIQICKFLNQSKAFVELICVVLFLKKLKGIERDYMTKNKKAYIAYNAYTKKMYALKKKMYAFVRKCVQYGNTD
jgi:hypothetical protein